MFPSRPVPIASSRREETPGSERRGELVPLRDPCDLHKKVIYSALNGRFAPHVNSMLFIIIILERVPSASGAGEKPHISCLCPKFNGVVSVGPLLTVQRIGSFSPRLSFPRGVYINMFTIA
ncbi:hypothetical protein DdX_06522 [Ditylenchus destructor]|uniref:Uncharacterized protein n=1 Tax=Ditylenchus destructor TaxID=166010 RepID=A0AAD4NB23_9BILA|nr:hypothetical protein DdX_06522 [Ditylenchus destructor]